MQKVTPTHFRSLTDKLLCVNRRKTEESLTFAENFLFVFDVETASFEFGFDFLFHCSLSLSLALSLGFLSLEMQKKNGGNFAGLVYIEHCLYFIPIMPFYRAY